MFDAMIDASYAALEKIRFGQMDVIVLERGWASRGYKDEAGENAITYNWNLVVPHLCLEQAEHHKIQFGLTASWKKLVFPVQVLSFFFCRHCAG